MARKKVVTTEEIDDSAAGGAESQKEVLISPEESELLDYLDGLGGNANLVKIHKTVDGRRAYCGQSEPGSITEDAILRKWGGGHYYLTAFMNGRFVPGGTRTLDLFQPPDDALKQATIQPENGNQNNSAILMLQEQINRQHEMMLKILESNKNDKPDMLEMIRVMKELQPPEQKPPDITGLLAPIMGLFEKSMELAQNASAGEDSKMGWFKIISQSIEKLPGMLSMMIPKKNGVERMETVAPEVAAQQMLTQGIAWLKKKALAGKDADLQVEVIADNLEDPNYRNLAVLILNQPFESFGQIDPEIMQEPLKSWFRQVYDGLKEVVANEHTNALAGESGSAADPSTDEGINN